MNYIPRPLNDSASSAMKKAESVPYGIILFLAQATLPIDYYFNRRIQETPGINTALDSEVTFDSTMHNLYEELDLPDKPTQLVDSDTKPLMDQEALDFLISKKPMAKRKRAQPFRRRQQNTISKDTYSSKTATTQSANSATAAEANSSNKTANQTQNSPKIGGRVAMLKSEWSRLTDSRWWHLARALRPTPSETPSKSTAAVPLASVHQEIELGVQKVLTEEDASLLSLKSIEKIQPKDPGFYIHLFNPEKDWSIKTNLGPTSELARVKGMRFSAYLDDLSTMGETKDECATITRLIYSKLSELGFEFYDEKLSTFFIPVYHTPGYAYQYKGNDLKVSVNQDHGS
ncbi:hypothetical protein AYI70_g7726 [Smittium culicis]|uniref:Uncharacterized protein n=1 Tax=Smittium culicis TaxID=133412 RepID=A0A1R1XJ98_9FUNG|nr:hypothetical protein AYI70_g7726 [Smittium culicis]